RQKPRWSRRKGSEIGLKRSPPVFINSRLDLNTDPGLRLDHDPRRMTGTIFTLFAPSFGQYLLPWTTATKRLIVLKHRRDHSQNLSRYSDFSRRQSPAPANCAI